MSHLNSPNKTLAQKEITAIPAQKSKRLGVDIPESYYEAFFLKARINKTDMSSLIRQWIKDYLDAS